MALDGRCARPAALLAALTAAVLSGCGSGPPPATSTTSSGTQSGQAGVPTTDPNAGFPDPCDTPLPPPSRVADPADWPVYHHTADRRGIDTTSPALGTPSIAWRVHLDGGLLAAPLIVQGRVIAATEADTVVALDASRGCLLWRTTVGTPMRSADLPCPDTFLGPLVGITGTPAVDVTTGTVYVTAFETPGRHELVALDLATGSVIRRVPVDPPGSHPLVQLARGALAIGNGRVYLTMGGRAGDCGDYHGYVIGVPLGGGVPETYTVPSEKDGGVWAPQGVTVLDDSDLLAVSGNGVAQVDPDGGNSVVRLTADLHPEDLFMPTNWAALNKSDMDLGSTGPALVGGGRAVQVGKEGVVYLLDVTALGGIGGQKASLTLKNCYAIGGTAAADGVAYLPCDHGVSAVRVDAAGTLTEAWRGPDVRAGSPIQAGGAIWSIDFEHGTLMGLDPATGALVASLDVGVSHHFVTPAAANGRLYLGAGQDVVAVSGI